MKVLIDPFLTGNPIAPLELDELEDFELLLVTHAHGDHLADAIALASKRKLTLVSSYEIAEKIQQETGASVVGMNIGGTYAYRNLKVTQVQAFHSHTGGPATGFILRWKTNSVYHAGDTGVFGDMGLLATLYAVNIACLPIGGHYTMDIDQAVEAVKLINPKHVIPMHYNTFDLIKADSKLFKQRVEEETTAKVTILNPGDEVEFP